jgi:hypothetical protein
MWTQFRAMTFQIPGCLSLYKISLFHENLKVEQVCAPKVKGTSTWTTLAGKFCYTFGHKRPIFSLFKCYLNIPLYHPKKYGNQKPDSFAYEYNVLTYLPLAVFCSLAASFETLRPFQFCTYITQTFAEHDSS